MEALNLISYDIIGAAYKVHSALGPGLLESTYEICLEYELKKWGTRLSGKSLCRLFTMKSNWMQDIGLICWLRIR